MTRLLLFLLAPALLRAQDTTQYRSMVGLNFGMPAYAGQPIPQLATIGVSWTDLRPNGLRLDGALGTAPYALGFGVFAGAARLGLVIPIEVAPSTYLMPMAGASVVDVDIAAHVFGGYVGASLVSWPGGPVGLRTTLTVHKFAGDDSHVVLGEIGLAWRFR